MLYSISFWDGDGIGLIVVGEHGVEGAKSIIREAGFDILRVVPADQEALAWAR